MPTSTANVATNVSTGKPKIAGSIYRALLSANPTIPTTASATLSSDFKCLGYIGDDGVKNGSSIENDKVKAWGGDVVLSYQKGRTDTFEFKMIEVLNEEVLKAVYVDANVTVTAATSSAPKSIAVAVNNAEQPDCVFVIDMVMRGNNPKRIVIPCAKISDVAEIVYKDDEAVGYDVTVTAAADSSGNTHYEYMTVGTATGT